MNYKEIRKVRDSYLLMNRIYGSLEEEGSVKSPLEGVSITELLRVDVAEYLMYLSAADGRIDEHEVRIYHVITGFKDTAKGILKYIKENDIYSTEYEKTVPYSMRVAVKAESLKIKAEGQKSGTSLPQLLYDMYESIGLTLLQADGGITKSERRDFNIYLNTLKEYIEENGFQVR